MLIVASAIATTRPTRSSRSFTPLAVVWMSSRLIYRSVSGYTVACEVRSGAPHTSYPRGAARTHPQRVVRCSRPAFRRARAVGRERRGDRRRGRLHARRLLRELRVEGGAPRRAAPAPRV